MLAALQPHRRFLHLHGEHRFEQRDGDLLAAAGLLALQQREQDRLHEMHAGGVVAERGRIDGQRLVVVALAPHHARQRLRENVLPALVGERPGLAEAGAEGADDARIDLGELVVAKAHALHHAGAEIVDDDVGVAHEIVDDRLAVGLAQIERDRALVAVEAAEHRIVEPVGIVGDRGAREIAGAGPLDLDDVGAVVGEHLRRARAQHHLGEIDDADARQRLIGSGLHNDDSLIRRRSATSALAAGRSPGSAPCARSFACSLATSMRSTSTSASSASAAATPAASPIAMQGGISRELRCADEVAE